MAALLETPSRIWRRIEAVEDQDMPSLPSVPAFEDSVDADLLTSQVLPQDSDEQTDDDDFDNFPSPKQSTPAASQHTATIRALSSINSTARFSNSAESRRSSFGLGGSSSTGSRTSHRNSNGLRHIPSLPKFNSGNSVKQRTDFSLSEDEEERIIPDIYLPQSGDNIAHRSDEQEFSITDALQSISRTGSPPPFDVDAFEDDGTPKKHYDYSVSLKSEPKVCTFLVLMPYLC